MILIKYMYPATPPTPYSLFVIGDNAFPAELTKLVYDSSLVRIKKGNREGNTFVAHKLIPCPKVCIACLGMNIIVDIDINKNKIYRKLIKT